MKTQPLTDLVTRLKQEEEGIEHFIGSRNDLKILNATLVRFKAVANQLIPLSITVDELRSSHVKPEHTLRLQGFWSFVLRNEKTKSETDKQHLRNIIIRNWLRKCNFFTALFLGLTFTVEVFKLFDDNALQRIRRLAEKYIQVYSLEIYFLQKNFVKVSKMLVGKVLEWVSDLAQFEQDTLQISNKSSIESGIGVPVTKRLGSTLHTIPDNVSPFSTALVAGDAVHFESYGPEATNVKSDNIFLSMHIAVLGGDVNTLFLRRLDCQVMTCNEDGELYLVESSRNSRLQLGSYQNAIESIRENSIPSLHMQERHSLDTDQQLNILKDPEWRREISLAITNPVSWKVTAVKAGLHSFPEHRQVEPLQYSALGVDFLPILKHVLPYLRDVEVVRSLGSAYLTKVTSICLSSSYFSTAEWKNEALDIAAGFLARQQEIFPHHKQIILQYKDNVARIELRKLALARLSRQKSSNELCKEVQFLIENYQRKNKRSNGWQGEMLLFHARVLVDMEELEGALEVLARFKPLDAEHISWLELIQTNDIEFVKGEITRYQGHFNRSLSIFQGLLKQKPTPPKVITQMPAVLSECGQFDTALQLLQDDLDTIKRKNSTTARRLALALAETLSMKATWMRIMGRSISDINSLISDAESVLKKHGYPFQQPKNLTYVGKITHFRFLLASAIGKHLIERDGEAIACWEEVQNASDELWPEGYTNMIIAYSLSDLYWRQCNRGKSEKLEEFVKCLHHGHNNHPKVKRSFYFLMFGTLWPQYLDTRKSRRGQEPLLGYDTVFHNIP